MRIVAMVPIKMNNERLPGKNIKAFSDGSPLLTVFLKTLVNVRFFDDIYVFCSSSEIKNYIIPCVKYLERPRFLDTQQTAPHEIINEFIKRVDADVYAVCHCTSPFVTAGHIEECVAAVKSGEHDSAFTAEKIQRLLWTNKNTPLNFEADNVPRTQDLLPIYSEVSAAYVFTKDIFEKTSRRIGFSPYITEVKGIECVDIDCPDDFEIANAIYMNLIKGKRR